MTFLHLILGLWICVKVSLLIVYGNLNRICIPLLHGNCVNLNYVELVHNAFQVYYSLLLLCTFILSISESGTIKKKKGNQIKWNKHTPHWPTLFSFDMQKSRWKKVFLLILESWVISPRLLFSTKKKNHIQFFVFSSSIHTY